MISDIRLMMINSEFKEGNREALQQSEIIRALYQLSVCYMCGVANEWSKGGRNPSLKPGAFAVSSGGSAPS